MLKYLALLPALLIPFASGAATVPAPPSLCVDSVCTAAPSTSAPTTSAKRWNPGYYAQNRYGQYIESQSNRFSLYDGMANETAIKGYRLVLHPRQAYPTQGDYTTAINLIRGDLNKLKSLSVPKRLIVMFQTGTYSPDAGNVFPAWMMNSGYTENTSLANVTQIKQYDVAVMTDWGKFLAAVVAAFDSDPYFEGLHLNYETSTSYSGSIVPAWTAAMDLVAAARKNSNLWITLTWPPSQAQANQLTAAAHARGIGLALLDVVADATDSYWRSFGEKAFVCSPGGGEYRGILPISAGIEDSEMGCNYVGTSGGYTPTQFGNYINNVLRASHVVYDMNEVCGSSEQRWSTGVLPYIRANAMPVHNRCPSKYEGRCQSN